VPAATHGNIGRFIREMSFESKSKTYADIFFHVYNVAIFPVLKTLRHLRKTQRNLRGTFLVQFLADSADEPLSFAEGSPNK
jgi:hypothetical protein